MQRRRRQRRSETLSYNCLPATSECSLARLWCSQNPTETPLHAPAQGCCRLGMASVELHEGACYAQVTSSSLALDAYAALVADDAAGAVATFTGVTRNSFQGKAVLWLEYEAYLPMAAKKLLVSAGRAAAFRWRHVGAAGGPPPAESERPPLLLLLLLLAGAVPGGVPALGAVQGGHRTPHGACGGGGGQRRHRGVVGAPP